MNFNDNRFDMASNFDQLVDKLVIRDKLKLGERIAQRAGEIAPVRTGNYRDSLYAEVIGEKVVVFSNDPGAVVIESGSSKQPPMAPIRRAADEIARLELNPKPGRGE